MQLENASRACRVTLPAGNQIHCVRRFWRQKVLRNANSDSQSRVEQWSLSNFFAVENVTMRDFRARPIIALIMTQRSRALSFLSAENIFGAKNKAGGQKHLSLGDDARSRTGRTFKRVWRQKHTHKQDMQHIQRNQSNGEHCSVYRVNFLKSDLAPKRERERVRPEINAARSSKGQCRVGECA